MTINDDNQKKSNQFSDEIISPMFGYDYKNRVVPAKNEKTQDIAAPKATSYLEKQIEEELEVQTKIAKAREYQETFKTDTDVLKQYHKQKENRELKDALPSNYLNFRDNLAKNSDESIVSDFDLGLDSLEMNSTISEIIEDILDK